MVRESGLGEAEHLRELARRPHSTVTTTEERLTFDDQPIPESSETDSLLTAAETDTRLR